MINGPPGNEGTNISKINEMNVYNSTTKYNTVFSLLKNRRNLESVSIQGTLDKSYFASIRKYARLIILAFILSVPFTIGGTSARRAFFLKNSARARRSLYHIGIHVAHMITRSGTIIIPHRRAQFIE